MGEYIYIAIWAVVVSVSGWLGVRLLIKASGEYKPDPQNPYGRPKIDLDQIHEVFSNEDPKRGEGRTVTEGTILAGILETTEESGVICTVEKYCRITDIMRIMVFDVFPKHGIALYQNLGQHSFAVQLHGGRFRKRINFILKDNIEMLHGNTWPLVHFTEFKEKDKREGFREIQ